MTYTAEKVVVELEAKLGKFKSDMVDVVREFDARMKRIEGSATRTEKEVKRATDGISRSFKNMLGGLSIAAIGRAVGGAIGQVAQLGEIAGRINISTKALQAMYRQAKLTGASMDEMERALQSVSEQAATSGSYLQKLFKANNASVSNSGEENLRTLMNLIKNAGTDMDKLAILTQITGDKVGRGLVQAFSQGGDAIEKTYADLEKAGEAHSEAEIQHMLDIRDKYYKYMDDISLHWQEMVVGMLGWTSGPDNPIDRINQELASLKQTRDDLIQNGPGILERLGLAGNELEYTNKQIAELEGKLKSLQTHTQVGTTKNEKSTKMPLAGQDLADENKRKELAKSIENIFRATEREVQSLRQEAEAQGKSTYEVARAAKERELLNDLEDEHRQNGGAVTEDEIKRAKELAETFAHITEEVATASDELSNLKDHADVVFGGIENALDTLIDTGKFNFKDFVGSIIKDLAKLEVHKILDQIENGKPGSGDGGVLGWLSKILNIGQIKTGPTAGANVGGATISRNPYDTQQGTDGTWHGPVTDPYTITPVPEMKVKPRWQTEQEGKVGAPEIYLEPGTGGSGGNPFDSGMRTRTRSGKGPGPVPPQFAEAFRQSNEAYGLPPGTLEAMGWKESHFDPNIRGPMTKSGERAEGIMQWMPSSAKHWRVNSFVPQDAISGSGRYMKWMMNRYGGDMPSALAGYNWGPGHVDDLLKRTGNTSVMGAFDQMPRQTRDYVTEIMKNQQIYAKSIGQVAKSAEDSAGKFDSSFGNALSSVVNAVSGGGGASAGTGGFDFGGLISGVAQIAGLFFAKGGVTDKPAIFGDNGPEAAVPLPDGRSIPVVLKSPPSTSSGMQKVSVEAYATEDLHLRIVNAADRNARRMDSRTLDTARRSYPQVQTRYRQLGTTSQ